MNIHQILPSIKELKEDNVPPTPTNPGEVVAAKRTLQYSFHLTPIHPVDKGWFGVLIENRTKYNNGGFMNIDAQVYFVYTNNGQKPTMRELFVLASSATVILNNYLKQNFPFFTQEMPPPIQKDHIESINAVITQAYPLS